MGLSLYMPATGIALELSQVPDPVFAEKMVGDGFAIDPLENTLYAPVSGTIKSIAKTKHAITIETENKLNVLVHFGLESVALNGDGLNVLVNEGDQVSINDALLQFDVLYVSSRIKSLITPVVISDYEGNAFENITSKKIQRHAEICRLNDVDSESNTKEDSSDKMALQDTKERKVVIGNTHGLHARPAANLAKAAKGFQAVITLRKGESKANVKSLVEVMALGIEYQDEIVISAQGENADLALESLCQLLANLHDDVEESDKSSLSDKVQQDQGKVEGNQYFGITASKGQVIGQLCRIDEIDFQFDENSTQSLEKEQKRLHNVLHGYAQSLKDSLNDPSLDKDKRSIILAHIELLEDEKLLQIAQSAIEQNKSAEFAWQKATDEVVVLLQSSNNQMMIERVADIKDIYKQILSALSGQSLSQRSYSQNTILFAEEFTLSDVLTLDENVVGLVSTKGGKTSHVAIIANNKRIPLVIQVAQKLEAHLDEEVILNAGELAGAVIEVNVTKDEKEAFLQKIRKQKQLLQQMQQDILLPATTEDGTEIKCYMNIKSNKECQNFKALGADGIGLFRTEFIYLDREKAPSEDEQLVIYQNLVAEVGNKPIIVRTLDAGGDKAISYLQLAKEENPFLGIRGIRLTLAHPELLRTQLRALIRTESKNVQIMFPMVSSLIEFRQAKAIYDEEHKNLGANVRQKLGIMVEVPSVIMQAKAFAKEVDFMSVGTNDLTQYIMAMDREHNELASEIDHLHPAVLIALSYIQKIAKEEGTKLSICGMMAADEEALAILIGLGIYDLSMRGNMLAENKALIRKLNKARCEMIASEVLKLDDAKSVREHVRVFLKTL